MFHLRNHLADSSCDIIKTLSFENLQNLSCSSPSFDGDHMLLGNRIFSHNNLFSLFLPKEQNYNQSDSTNLPMWGLHDCYQTPPRYRHLPNGQRKLPIPHSLTSNSPSSPIVGISLLRSRSSYSSDYSRCHFFHISYPAAALTSDQLPVIDLWRRSIAAFLSLDDIASSLQSDEKSVAMKKLTDYRQLRNLPKIQGVYMSISAAPQVGHVNFNRCSVILTFGIMTCDLAAVKFAKEWFQRMSLLENYSNVPNFATKNGSYSHLILRNPSISTLNTNTDDEGSHTTVVDRGLQGKEARQSIESNKSNISSRPNNKKTFKTQSGASLSVENPGILGRGDASSSQSPSSGDDVSQNTSNEIQFSLTPEHFDSNQPSARSDSPCPHNPLATGAATQYLFLDQPVFLMPGFNFLSSSGCGTHFLSQLTMKLFWEPSDIRATVGTPVAPIHVFVKKANSLEKHHKTELEGSELALFKQQYQAPQLHLLRPITSSFTSDYECKPSCQKPTTERNLREIIGKEDKVLQEKHCKVSIPRDSVAHYVGENITFTGEGEHVLGAMAVPTEAYEPFLPCLTATLNPFLVFP